MRQPSTLYKRHRFPGKIISHAMWWYYRFLLSYRDVEGLLAERGIANTYTSGAGMSARAAPAARPRVPGPPPAVHLLRL